MEEQNILNLVTSSVVVRVIIRVSYIHLHNRQVCFLEPGIYLKDFGVRLENVLEVVEKPHIKNQYGHSFLGFKVVTLVPYSRKLMNVAMLSLQQVRL